MTGHAAAGQLLAFLDGELPVDERASLSEHLGECLDCRRRLEGARARAGAVSTALSALDVPAPTDAAWAEVRSRLAPLAGADLGRHTGPSVLRWPLARAAGLVLLLAGGAAAAVIPGSPVRSWIFGDANSVPAATAEAEVGAQPVELGAMADPEAGAVAVVLTVPPESEIVVRRRGTRAGVFGPEGTGFTSGAGRLEARAPAGPVRIELPASSTSSSLRINGRVVLTIVEGRVAESPADAVGDLRTPDSALRFRAR